MFAPLYNRLCGWTFFTLGLIGFSTGSLGDYIHFSSVESLFFVAVGVCGMLAARARRRESVILCFVISVILLIAGLCGFFLPYGLFGAGEPLENILQVVAGGWGVYAAGSDVLKWIQSL